MADFKTRLNDEIQELTTRHDKLIEFIGADKFLI